MAPQILGPLSTIHLFLNAWTKHIIDVRNNVNGDDAAIMKHKNEHKKVGNEERSLKIVRLLVNAPVEEEGMVARRWLHAMLHNDGNHISHRENNNKLRYQVQMIFSNYYLDTNRNPYANKYRAALMRTRLIIAKTVVVVLLIIDVEQTIMLQHNGTVLTRNMISVMTVVRQFSTFNWMPHTDIPLFTYG